MAAFNAIHDYVSAVHPRLLSVKDRLRHGMYVQEEELLPPETILMVSNAWSEPATVKEHKDWVTSRRSNFQINSIQEAVVP